MQDEAELDKKYFIDEYVYNCPFCNRRHVEYGIRFHAEFNWSIGEKCYVYFVECQSCKKMSMHLAYDSIKASTSSWIHGEFGWLFKKGIDIDSHMFYSQPTSFFVVDSRIPRILRELITEAEGCLKMNYLTGASACMRKAIYELLVIEKAEGDDYESRIKSLKQKHKDTDPSLFDILAHIQQMTSDKIHEQSWDEWDSLNLKLIIGTLKTVLYDVYVIPQVRKESSIKIQELLSDVKRGKGKTAKEINPAELASPPETPKPDV